MRVFSCRSVLLATICVASSATLVLAQSGHESAYVARIRSPAGRLTAPSLATIAKEVTGIGVHLLVGSSDGDGGGTVYAIGVDLPTPLAERPALLRFGLTAGIVNGSCRDELRSLVPCVVGHLYGVNAVGRILGERSGAAANSPTLAVGWTADLGTARVRSGTSRFRSFSAGLGAPVSVSFRPTSKSPLAEKDPRFKPHTTVYVEPGISLGTVRFGDRAIGVLPQITAGLSILQIGPGFGVSASARDMLLGDHHATVSIALSWHGPQKSR